MRGRKRLRKKLSKKNAAKAKINISLVFNGGLSQGASIDIIKQFKNEYLKPAGLRFEAKSTDIGWNGEIENEYRSPLTEEHREMIADWAFMRKEVSSYAVSHISKG